MATRLVVFTAELQCSEPGGPRVCNQRGWCNLELDKLGQKLALASRSPTPRLTPIGSAINNSLNVLVANSVHGHFPFPFPSFVWPKITWSRACWKMKYSLPQALLLLLHQVCRSNVCLVRPGQTNSPATSIRVTVRGGHGWPGALREVSLSARNLGFKLSGKIMTKLWQNMAKLWQRYSLLYRVFF